MSQPRTDIEYAGGSRKPAWNTHHVVYPKDGTDKPWAYVSGHKSLEDATAACKSCGKTGAAVIKGLTGGEVRNRAMNHAHHLHCSCANDESTAVRQSYNAGGFRETEKNVDAYDQHTHKVAQGIEKLYRSEPEKARMIVHVRNQVAAQLFKHRMGQAAKGAGFKKLPLGEGIDPKELAKGKEEEKEHTSPEQLSKLKKADSKKAAELIAKDHLKTEPKYYTKLDKAGLAEAIAEIKSGKSVSNVITEALGTENEKHFVMIPHSAQDVHTGKPITKERIAKLASSAGSSDYHKGTVHDKDFAKSGGDKHHAVQFAQRRYAQKFHADLANHLNPADHERVQVTT